MTYALGVSLAACVPSQIEVGGEFDHNVNIDIDGLESDDVQFTIEAVEEGYVFGALPTDLTETFPGDHLMAFTISHPDGDHITSTVIGVASRDALGSLFVETEDVFDFDPRVGSMLALESLEGRAGSGWGGCSWPGREHLSQRTANICWCYSNLTDIPN